MLALAQRQTKQINKSITCLKDFLSSHIEHNLGQDAIYCLAQLEVEVHAGNIERGVRLVLSYQETRDQVRARFCVWAAHFIAVNIQRSELDDAIVKVFSGLRHLIDGFEDQQVIMRTIAVIIDPAIQHSWSRLHDLGAAEAVMEQQEYVTQLRAMGYPIKRPVIYSPGFYLDLSRQLYAVADPRADHLSVKRLLKDAHRTIDLLYLVAHGCSEMIYPYLCAESDPSPSFRMFRGGLAQRLGYEDQARADCESCFQLMDLVEVERTNAELATVARLAFYAMGLLPWQSVWEHCLIAQTSLLLLLGLLRSRTISAMPNNVIPVSILSGRVTVLSPSKAWRVLTCARRLVCFFKARLSYLSNIQDGLTQRQQR